MKHEPIEETYFNWLYSQVASVNVQAPSNMFYTLLRDLHATEFVWMLQGDDNRAEDGLDVRKEFLMTARLDQDPAWLNLGCSVLEMLIAFSRRAEFDTGDSARDWFWIFMNNLNLAEMSDARDGVSQTVYEVMDQFIWRTYEFNGQGGLFPLRQPKRDQRKIELWAQFFDFLVDNEDG